MRAEVKIRYTAKEAAALVAEIVRCCADPAYDGKTMGVISLRGSKAHLAEMENLLAESLDYEQREARRIRSTWM